MKKQVVIVGSGFAGMWAAISAARLRHESGTANAIDITVISPRPNLVIRPRLYEASLEGMEPDIGPLFQAVGVKHVAGMVDSIDAAGHCLSIRHADGVVAKVRFDKLVLASGSSLFLPNIPGLEEYTFNVDQLDAAVKLQTHLQSLASRADSPARNTAVVIGGGFTGIETAAELPARLKSILGDEAPVRVIVLERAPHIGPELGRTPRPIIEQALAECGVEVSTNAAVAALEKNGVRLASGELIQSDTVIWSAGARAHSLAEDIAGDRDSFGRIVADSFLRAGSAPNVFVTGDVAHAQTDELGNVAAMACQHALSLGRVAGHNAVAELVSLPLHPYAQPKYVTCLDIGAWGALYTEGWDRAVHLTGQEGKNLKRQINTEWIYPPAADRDVAFALAKPDHVIVAA